MLISLLSILLYLFIITLDFLKQLSVKALSWTGNIPTRKYFEFYANRLEKNINFDLRNTQNRSILFPNQFLSDFNKTGTCIFILIGKNFSILLFFIQEAYKLIWKQNRSILRIPQIKIDIFFKSIGIKIKVFSCGNVTSPR